MKTFTKLLLLFGLVLVLTAFFTPKVTAQCDPDIPEAKVLPYPGHAPFGAMVTYPHTDANHVSPQYINFNCGLNDVITVDPCNPWTMEFYIAGYINEDFDGDTDYVKFLYPTKNWDSTICQEIFYEPIYPAGYVFGSFADSVVIKVTMRPHKIVGCVGNPDSIIVCDAYGPPVYYEYSNCWRTCMHELLTFEVQNECSPPNSALCRIEWDKPLPVELASFTSAVKDNTVTLNWTTTREENNARFIIQRGNSGEWTDIGMVAGNGTTNNLSSYSFTDKNLNSGIYNYRLKQVDYNGNSEYLNLNNAVAVGVPMNFTLSQNYPNPFNPTTTILYGVPNDGNVTMKVYDNNGREIKTLVSGPMSAGYYTINFNASGLSSGVYFYKLESGNFVATKKMVIMK